MPKSGSATELTRKRTQSEGILNPYGGLWIDYDELVIEKEIGRSNSSVVYLGN